MDDIEFANELLAEPEFQKWPSIPRLYRNIIITEKIDGSNAAVGVTERGQVYAQSRKRIITPEDDNFGFARFVQAHADEFREKLGIGLHFGEWYGSGIQRGYGLQGGKKRFALFNVKRWILEDLPPQVETVPYLYEGVFSEAKIREVLDNLRRYGSGAATDSPFAPFMNPEGIIVFFTQPQLSFKITLENDEMSKGEAKQQERDNVRQLKSNAIMEMRFEDAASLRDLERVLSRELAAAA